MEPEDVYSGWDSSGMDLIKEVPIKGRMDDSSIPDDISHEELVLLLKELFKLFLKDFTEEELEDIPKKIAKYIKVKADDPLEAMKWRKKGFSIDI
jgi:hypothetical protein